MAQYPTSLPVRADSLAAPVDHRIPVRASNGALKVRSMHTTEKLSFTVLHDLSAVQRAALEAHYSGDKTNSFSFRWPLTGTTHTVVYAARPSYQPYPSGYATATVRLDEV